VSKNDNSHCTGTTKVTVKVMGKKALTQPWKTDIEGANMTCWDRLWSTFNNKCKINDLWELVA